MNFPPPTPRQAHWIWLAGTGLAMAVLVALVVALLWGLGRIVSILSPVLWPLAIAAIIACLLDPVVDGLEKKGTSRAKAIAGVFAVALIIIAALFGSIVPQLINETRQLAARIPDYSARIQARVETWMSHPPPWVEKLWQRETNETASAASASTNNEALLTLTTNAAGAPVPATTNNPAFLTRSLDKRTLETAAGWLVTALRKAGVWLFGQVASWFGILAGLALIPVYAFYFLLEKRSITSRWTDYLPVSDSAFKNELVFVLNAMNGYLVAFFRGQVLVAICDGILYGIGFLLVGLPYALLIGVAAMALTIIPFLGAIIVFLTALAISVVQFGDWLHPFMVLVVFGIVQALEGLVISPRIMGGRVGLHPLTIIIAVMVGTTLLGGLLGGILAIPLTAALRVVMFRYVWRRGRET